MQSSKDRIGNENLSLLWQAGSLFLRFALREIILSMRLVSYGRVVLSVEVLPPPSPMILIQPSKLKSIFVTLCGLRG